MIDKDVIRSFPYDRAIRTSSLKPRAASQAPRVKIIKLKKANGTWENDITIGTNRTSDSIMLSRASRAINR